MIVVAVLGTLATMALPSVNATMRHRRLIAATNALTADLEVAFSLAGRQRKPVTISYDATSGEVRVADRASGTVYLRRPLGSTSEYRLDSVVMTPASVQLFPSGVSSSAFRIHLSNGAYQRQIGVARTGLARVTVP